MGKNTSISLGEHFNDFIDEEISQGRYATVSEVVRAGLRLLEEQELRLQALRAALDEGETSGTPVELNFEDFLNSKRRTKPA
ncbi:antitoxin ParD1/3/4 [Phyllobacterium sp. YR620]|uniref:type II toxin-antitoxin system ParD family antitoxin n=1 Tax=Phyllobacterium sp. YR620 TaxID=1881066 RepID=UPI0008880DB2|nr:type II toxin-antitoxin system ParD family antitoxin [Phyllobacterium sp. YR620]SDO95279.1 antitoxin ParD1/3/4 [Phyllobacterium sp. YR620]